MRVSKLDFFDNGRYVKAFDDLVMSCMSKRNAIRLTFSDEYVDLALDESTESGSKDKVRLAGASVVARNGYNTAGARLLLPLISSVKDIRLPYQHVFSTRLHKRSIADFFARNLFFALGRQDDVQYDVCESFGTEAESELQSEFVRRYLWILRHYVNDPVLHERDVIEKLLINGHLDTLSFEDVLLSAGAEEIRRHRSQCHPKVDRKEQLGRLMQVREKMMVHFA